MAFDDRGIVEELGIGDVTVMFEPMFVKLKLSFDPWRDMTGPLAVGVFMCLEEFGVFG